MKAIVIDRNDVNYELPRVGQFGGLRIYGKGNLSGALNMFPAITGETEVYVEGNLYLTDALGNNIGKKASVITGNAVIRIKATSTNGGYLFIGNNTLRGFGDIRSTDSIGLGFTASDTANSPFAEYNIESL
ncbi:hypothetical protein D0T53_13500, partial [Dysgonomonas sp. 216]|uniref:hypothetical protein n=1 Tax=Dysgonomonas sp. 216 TaxID=2302934 RepID=UPI0013D34253